MGIARIMRKTKPGRLAPASSTADVGAIAPGAGSKADFEESLSSSRRVALANLATIDDAKVGVIDVVCAVEVGVADLESIEEVSKFHSQLCTYPFTEIEVLSQCEILIAVERAAQVGDATGRATQGEVSW